MITASYVSAPTQPIVSGDGSGFTATLNVLYSLIGDGVATSFVHDVAKIDSNNSGLGALSVSSASITPQQTGGLPPTWRGGTVYALNTIVASSNGRLEKVTTAGTSSGTNWQSGVFFSVGQQVYDPFGNLQNCVQQGISGTNPLVFSSKMAVGQRALDGQAIWQSLGFAYPAWGSTLSGTLTDGTVVWTDQGPNNVVNQFDSPNITTGFIGTVLTVTANEPLKALGVQVTDAYGNVFTYTEWALNIVFAFASSTTGNPAFSLVHEAQTVPVTGSVAITNFPATQPVSIAAAVDISDRAARLLGHVTVDNVSIAVTGTFFQATQPISGAISFTAPQHVINDASAAVIGHVITDSGSTTVVTGSVAVTGTFFPATQPVSIAAAVKVVGNIGATLDTPINGAASTNAVWTENAPATAAAASCLVANAVALATKNIKASAGNVYGLTVANKASLIIYLQFYNTAGVPVLGTGVQWWVPISSGATLVIPPGTFGLGNFTTGIGMGVATSATGSGVPPVAPDVTVWYI